MAYRRKGCGRESKNKGRVGHRHVTEIKMELKCILTASKIIFTKVVFNAEIHKASWTILKTTKIITISCYAYPLKLHYSFT